MKTDRRVNSATPKSTSEAKSKGSVLKSARALIVRIGVAKGIPIAITAVALIFAAVRFASRNRDTSFPADIASKTNDVLDSIDGSTSKSWVQRQLAAIGELFGAYVRKVNPKAKNVQHKPMASRAAKGPEDNNEPVIMWYENGRLVGNGWSAHGIALYALINGVWVLQRT